MKIGVYLGSFNPFHKGHLDVVQNAASILDSVVIVQAHNLGKTTTPEPIPLSVSSKYKTYKASVGDSVNSILDMVLEQAIYSGCDGDLIPPPFKLFIVRGFRNGFDVNEEQNYVQHLKAMGVTNQVLHIMASLEHQHISSSAIRAIEAVGGTHNYRLES